jgi:hypothetical protein
MSVQSMCYIALLAVSSLSTLPRTVARAQEITVRASSLDQFVSAESTTALQGILENIGPAGPKASGTDSGIVIASPSKVNPNCTSKVESHLTEKS